MVGRSGAGKTTIATLLPRFYQPVAGAILIDGADITSVTVKSLRDSIGIVPQDAVLFTASIPENVQYGRPRRAGHDSVGCARAGEYPRVRPIAPDQLDTMIGEEGIRPSTGQRQRLALARVFLKNPPILILDEATSGLDSEVENLFHDSVWRLTRGRTSFLIAHRLASAVDADVIIVCDQGRIVESGTRLELLAKGGVYAQLHNEQARKLMPSKDHTMRRPGSLMAAAKETAPAKTGT